MREGRSRFSGRGELDVHAVGIGGPLSGLMALAAALLLRSWIGEGGGRPTAAALDEGFSLLYGAAIGLAVGSALVAFATRTGARTLTGLLAGLLGYAVVLAPTVIATAPSDVSVGESVSVALLAAVLVTPAILLGAAAGATLAGFGRTGLQRRTR